MQVEAELEAAREGLAAATLAGKLHPASGAAGGLGGAGSDGGTAGAGSVTGTSRGRFASMLSEGLMVATRRSASAGGLGLAGAPDREAAVQQLKAVRCARCV